MEGVKPVAERVVEWALVSHRGHTSSQTHCLSTKGLLLCKDNVLRTFQSQDPTASGTIYGSPEDTSHSTDWTSPDWHDECVALSLQPLINLQVLQAEINGIRCRLEVVEKKCINIDAALLREASFAIGTEEWQSLIALHRTLLYTHHDLLGATQYLSTATHDNALASDPTLQTRMWKNGIHLLLEVMRVRLPSTQEHMLGFLRLAYQMVALFVENEPTLAERWIELLGDLSRHFMAIAKERDLRESWAKVARRWYTMASDHQPHIGRLHHHVAVLPASWLNKFVSYVASVTCKVPFIPGHESIRRFCRSAIERQRDGKNLASVELAFIDVYAAAYLGVDDVVLDTSVSTAQDLLRNERLASMQTYVVPLVVISISALLGFGSPDNVLGKSFLDATEDDTGTQSSVDTNTPDSVYDLAASSLLSSTRAERTLSCYFAILDKVIGNGLAIRRGHSTLTALHIVLVWFNSLCRMTLASRNTSPNDLVRLLMDPARFSWHALCAALNNIDSIRKTLHEIGHDTILHSVIPLPEDYLFRGLLWAHYYPFKNFLPRRVPTHSFPTASRWLGERERRVAWLANSLLQSPFIRYDVQKREFWTPVSQPTDTSASFMKSLPDCSESDVSSVHVADNVLSSDDVCMSDSGYAGRSQPHNGTGPQNWCDMQHARQNGEEETVPNVEKLPKNLRLEKLPLSTTVGFSGTCRCKKLEG